MNRVILLDPGHGGRDPGALGLDLQEKDMTLQLALAWRKILQAAGYTVILSRAVDLDFSPEQWKGADNDLWHRIQMVNRCQTDVLVSIHMDSFQPKPGAPIPSGNTAYYAQTSPRGFRLATCLYAEILPLPLVDRGVNSDAVSRHGRLGILRKTKPPAALLECGFICSPKDTTWTLNPSNQDLLGEAVRRGLDAYFSSTV